MNFYMRVSLAGEEREREKRKQKAKQSQWLPTTGGCKHQKEARKNGKKKNNRKI